MRWRFHLDVKITADKYLLPELSSSADWYFRQTVGAEKDIDTVHDILQAIWKELCHNDKLIELAEALRQEHLSRLLRYAPYRSYLETDMFLLWKQFDELAYADDLVPKQAICCRSHEQMLNNISDQSGKCYQCSSPPNIYPPQKSDTTTPISEGEKVWVAKDRHA